MDHKGADTLTAWKEALRVGISEGGGSGPEAISSAGAGADVEDGIFTASEVATLDLRKTALAAVPACVSRVDVLRPSSGEENLLALERAFSVSGAHQVLLSLWPVEDKAVAAEFMSDLQKKLQDAGLAGQGTEVNADVAALFQDVQREWLVRLRTNANGGLIKAVSTAGPFVLMQGVRARK